MMVVSTAVLPVDYLITLTVYINNRSSPPPTCSLSTATIFAMHFNFLYGTLLSQEVYEGDSRVWKENAEWVAGGGCCRKMVPMEEESNGYNHNANGHNHSKGGCNHTSSSGSSNGNAAQQHQHQH